MKWRFTPCRLPSIFNCSRIPSRIPERINNNRFSSLHLISRASSQITIMALTLNTSIFGDIIGKLKLATVVVGVIDLGLTADKFVAGESREEYFLAIVIILFAVSIILIALSLMGLLDQTDVVRKAELGYHVIGGILLFIGAIVWFVSISRYRQFLSGPVHTQRIFSGIFGLLNSGIYLAIGGLIFKNARAPGTGPAEAK